MKKFFKKRSERKIEEQMKEAMTAINEIEPKLEENIKIVEEYIEHLIKKEEFDNSEIKELIETRDGLEEYKNGLIELRMKINLNNKMNIFLENETRNKVLQIHHLAEIKELTNQLNFFFKNLNDEDKNKWEPRI